MVNSNVNKPIELVVNEHKHFHTTGRMRPSKEDIKLTDRMDQVCSLIGIPLVDHVIVGPGDTYFSFKEKMEMPITRLHFTDELENIELEGIKVAETATLEKTKKDIVSFTVAECGEFHSMGELHENVPTLKEAIALFEKIPPERMNGIPAIGIRATNPESPELFTEIDVMTSKRIDLEVLGYVPKIGENSQAQFAVAEMLHSFPDKEVIGAVPESIQKKVQVIESREKQANQLKEVTDQLEQGVQDVFNSDSYKQFLNVMSKMPKYSINNMLLIAMQTEGKASLCQSYSGWKSMGRHVKAGEKGLKILAPSPYTIQKEQNKIDQKTGKVIVDRDGEPLKETVDIKINAFKVVSTFDISQTDGKELPTLGVNELVGNIEGYSTLLAALKQTCPVPITFEDIEGGAKGFYHQTDKRIAIQDGMSEVQTVKTAIHEMAHQKLHAKENQNPFDTAQSRNSKEVEAESVAYVVCQHFGINTSDYSFSYVAGWSEGKETPELKESLETIREAAGEMIDAIDKSIEKEIAAIEAGTDIFTKIYMDDPDRGELMMGEYNSQLNYDPDMRDSAVEEAKRIVDKFLVNENPTEADIRQVGKEILTLNRREGEEFMFAGCNLLSESGVKDAEKELAEKAKITSAKSVDDYVSDVVKAAKSNTYYLQDDDTFNYREGCDKSFKIDCQRTANAAHHNLTPQEFQNFVIQTELKLNSSEFKDTNISFRTFHDIVEKSEKDLEPKKETAKKPSVRKKIQDKKEKAVKPTAKKTKEKEAEACV